MSFAVWWALTTLPTGFWPSLGSTGIIGSTHWFFQTSLHPLGGRPQLSLQHKSLSLRYTLLSTGWAWQITGRHFGVWFAPNLRGGLSGHYRGKIAKHPWSGQLSISRYGWVARAQWADFLWFRNTQGLQSISYNWNKTRIQAQWAPDIRSLSLQHGGLTIRRTESPYYLTDLVKFQEGRTIFEWRSTNRDGSLQRQFGIQTSRGSSRLSIQYLELSGLYQIHARLNLHHPTWGTITTGILGRQRLLRYSIPEGNSWRGSFIEWGRTAQLHLVNKGHGIGVVWDPYQKRWSAQFSARHLFRRTIRKESLTPKLSSPCWLDINYRYSGKPPNVEIELHGKSRHQVVLIPQNRQWKDHVPPGRYAVQGSAPKGWELELPKDSIILSPGIITPIWIGLRPRVTQIRWINGPGESPE